MTSEQSAGYQPSSAKRKYRPRRRHTSVGTLKRKTGKTNTRLTYTQVTSQTTERARARQILTETDHHKVTVIRHSRGCGALYSRKCDCTPP